MGSLVHDGIEHQWLRAEDFVRSGGGGGGLLLRLFTDGCADSDQEVHDFLFGKILQRTAFVMTAADWLEGYGETL